MQSAANIKGKPINFLCQQIFLQNLSLGFSDHSVGQGERLISEARLFNYVNKVGIIFLFAYRLKFFVFGLGRLNLLG